MWNRIDVVFSLVSPLHIGYLPFIKGGVISPTRYYVPGRNFWGAITKRATENLYKNPSGNKYKEIGKQIKDNFRFSYFYLYDNKTIFIPEYNEKEGLFYGDKEHIDKTKFEYRFIGSRVLTAIDSSSGTAKEKALHEIEFIKNKFVDGNGEIKNTKLIGCIWIKNDCKVGDYTININNGISLNDFNLIEELTLGGEQGYGFGVVKLQCVFRDKKFPIEDNKINDEVEIIVKDNKPILSHLQYEKDVEFKGEIEPMIGRGYFDIEKPEEEGANEYKVNAGKVLSDIKYYFTPGSVVKNKNFILNWDGTLKVKKENASC